MSVVVTYSYHFAGVGGGGGGREREDRGFLVELQWHVNQSKTAVGFLMPGFHFIVTRS